MNRPVEFLRTGVCLRDETAANRVRILLAFAVGHLWCFLNRHRQVYMDASMLAFNWPESKNITTAVFARTRTHEVFRFYSDGKLCFRDWFEVGDAP